MVYGTIRLAKCDFRLVSYSLHVQILHRLKLLPPRSVKLHIFHTQCSLCSVHTIQDAGYTTSIQAGTRLRHASSSDTDVTTYPVMQSGHFHFCCTVITNHVQRYRQTYRRHARSYYAYRTKTQTCF